MSVVSISRFDNDYLVDNRYVTSFRWKLYTWVWAWSLHFNVYICLFDINVIRELTHKDIKKKYKKNKVECYFTRDWKN